MRSEAEHRKAGTLPRDKNGTKVVNPEFWRRGLLTTKRGNVKANLANVMHVLSLHPAWTGVLAYDDFAECVVTLKPPPMRALDAPEARAPGDWTETDSIRTTAWLQAEAGIDAGVDMVTAAVIAIAERTRVHPVRDWLSSLKWDSTPRLDRLLPAYFGTDDTTYTRAVGARWMISAVARVFEPGCQADCMLVLEGAQGRRKSTGFERLTGRAWFADTPIDLASKDAYQSLRRKWVYEIAELDSFKGREVTKIKAFISARSDNYRPSYGRRNRDFSRQVVFCGTTNETEYLTDRSGNRRFWPALSRGDVDVEAIGRDREQLWAEALVRYRAGERWYVDTPELRELCEAEQAARVPDDAWVPIVRQWLVHPTVPERGEGRRLLDLDEGVTTSDVLFGALGLKSVEATPAAAQHAARVLRELKFQRRQARIGADREWRYFRVSPPDGDLVTPPGDADAAKKGSCHQVTNVTSAYVRAQENMCSVRRSGFQEIAGDTGDLVTAAKNGCVCVTRTPTPPKPHPGDTDDVDADIEREAIQAEGGAE